MPPAALNADCPPKAESSPILFTRIASVLALTLLLAAAPVLSAEPGEAERGPAPEGPAAGYRVGPGDKVIVADADVWVDPTGALEADTAWAVPHLKVHRLSDCATVRMIAGEPWRGLPLDRSNQRDCKPYNGQPAGGVVVLNRSVIESCTPDPRFVGWGHEDVAWDAALTSLFGSPWRGTADLVHLWHPAQPRLDRATGTHQSKALMRRYLNAARRPDLIRGILMEVP
jgi:hypothetical protein